MLNLLITGVNLILELNRSKTVAADFKQNKKSWEWLFVEILNGIDKNLLIQIVVLILVGWWGQQQKQKTGFKFQ